jgi:hypothetical protein
MKWSRVKSGYFDTNTQERELLPEFPPDRG